MKKADSPRAFCAAAGVPSLPNEKPRALEKVPWGEASGRQGVLIAFEGIDGTGKSTQIRLAADWLREVGCAVVTTREPTDGPFGARIRATLTAGSRMAAAEELHLFLEDRRDHVRQLIAPALATGKIVLTDRYYLSTVAYQGAAGQDPAAIFARNEAFAPPPDLVLLLVAPVDLGRDRIRFSRGEQPNSFEGRQYLERVAAVFDSMAQPYIRRIDASQSIERVHHAIRNQVENLLTQHGFLPPVNRTGLKT